MIKFIFSYIYSDNHKTHEQEEDLLTQVMILNMRRHIYQFCSGNRPILLEKYINKLLVKLFAYYKH